MIPRVKAEPQAVVTEVLTYVCCDELFTEITTMSIYLGSGHHARD